LVHEYVWRPMKFWDIDAGIQMELNFWGWWGNGHEVFFIPQGGGYPAIRGGFINQKKKPGFRRRGGRPGPRIPDNRPCWLQFTNALAEMSFKI